MRRSEFSIQEQQEIDAFLQEMSFGYLGTLGEDGWPHLTPLNYSYHNGHIYFHGSKKGAKMDEILASQKVSFAVAKEYAIIPSYFSDPRQACPATAYFKSVHMRGTAEPVDDLHEKALALSGLMEKLQPEGGYAPITPGDSKYIGELKAVSVVKISIQDMTAKFKFGQNLKEERRGKVIEGLKDRGRQDDEAAVEMMMKYCPMHKQ